MRLVKGGKREGEDFLVEGGRRLPGNTHRAY